MLIRVFLYAIFNNSAIFQDELIPHELSRRGIRASRYQRAFLSVCLFFFPKLLHSDHIVMRNIVDTFFSEEWVCFLQNKLNEFQI